MILGNSRHEVKVYMSEWRHVMHACLMEGAYIAVGSRQVVPAPFVSAGVRGLGWQPGLQERIMHHASLLKAWSASS